jgi:hypothetical protein
VKGLQLVNAATAVLPPISVPVEEPSPKRQPKPPAKTASKGSLEEDFCRASDFGFLLEYGWKRCGNDFTRPGKDHGVSASVIAAKDGTPLLHVFTSSAPPFEKDDNLNPFDAYRLLVHNGDAEAARATLVKEGFGRLRIKLITCMELHSNKYELDYLIPGFYVAAQPCIVAGPKKALKTSLLIALAIALATGLPFLASFVVTRAVKVIMLSGESGMAVLQETARRICKSMGVSLPDIKNLLWSDFLPQLGDPRHLDALERMIEDTGCEVLIVDPAYLCLPGADASNLFIQGSLLRSVSEICQRHGVGLVLAHHLRKRGKAKNAADYDPPELDDMAWAGFQEFARQWILLGRREQYEPGTGEHELWLSVGGSAGHSGLWGLDISEGVSGQPRHWNIELSTPDQAREEKKGGTLRQRILAAAKEFSEGETKTTILETAGLKSEARVRNVFDALVNEGLLVSCKVRKKTATYDGFRLSGETAKADLPETRNQNDGKQHLPEEEP